MMDRRYDHVTGGESQRMYWYLARRKLGLSHREWERLPWPVQQAYVDGMEREGLIQRQPASGRDAEDPLAGALPGADWR